MFFKVTETITVEQQIFAHRKFSRISRIFRNTRKFHAREYYQNAVWKLLFHQAFTETRAYFKAGKAL